MTALPAASDWTGSSVTEGGFKTAQTSLRDYLSGLLDTTGTTAAALTKLGAVFNDTLAKTAAYTVVAADKGKVIDATTGTWTLTLTAAATLGDGFAFVIKNSGTGVITIDPNLTETIDDATTLAISAGQMSIVYCTGTEWYTLGSVADNSIGADQLNVSGDGTSGQVLSSDGDGSFSWAAKGLDTTPTGSGQSSQGLTASGGSWTPSAGYYNFYTTSSDTTLQFYFLGSWRSLAERTGTFWTDGANVRIYNNAVGSQTVYYEKVTG